MKTVKVYLLNVNAVRGKQDYLLSYLSYDRVKKAEKFVLEEDRLLSLSSGCLINRFCGEYYTDKFGKPRCDNVFFSVSHSKDYAAIALSDSDNIGIDIEFDDPKLDTDTIAGACFSTEEFQKYKSGIDAVMLFVSKESLSKAEGTGLKSDIKSIPAYPLNGKLTYKNNLYYRHTFDLNGYFASVTAQNDDFEIITEEIYEIR